MDKRLQQRLIGAAVLIALAVIFLPMLLNGGGGSKHVSVKMKLPPEPNYKFTNNTPKPLAPQQNSGNSSVQKQLPVSETASQREKVSPPTSTTEQNKAKPTPLSPSTSSSPKATLPAAGKPQSGSGKKKAKNMAPPPSQVNAPSAQPTVSAWVVQVASFTKENSALALRNRLRKAGFSSYIDRYKHTGHVYYRVRVGPKLSHAKAENMLKRITRVIKLKGMLVPYR